MLLTLLINFLVNKIAKQFPERKCCRKCGMKAYNASFGDSAWNRSQKLFMELYLENSLCACITLHMFIFDDKEFRDHFSTFGDALSNSLCLLVSAWLLIFPLINYVVVKRHFLFLSTPPIMGRFGFFFEDIKLTNQNAA